MKVYKSSLAGSFYLPGSLVLCFGLLSGSVKSVPKTHTVEISQMAFTPAKLLVPKGDTVLFINKDIVIHDVTATSEKSFKSPPLRSGQSWRLVATKSAAYYCSFHPVMKGTLTVK